MRGLPIGPPPPLPFAGIVLPPPPPPPLANGPSPPVQAVFVAPSLVRKRPRSSKNRKGIRAAVHRDRGAGGEQKDGSPPIKARYWNIIDIIEPFHFRCT